MIEMVPAWLDGTLTPVEKLEVHRRGLRHLAVSVFVMNGSRTLLQRRALGKYHTPGLWANACCTHPRWGEEPLACATRRLREELGLTGLALRRVGGIEYRADVGGGLTEHEVVDLFVAEAALDQPFQPNPDEVMQTAWVSLSDLSDQIKAEPARFTPWLRIYLAEGWGKVAETLQGRDAAHA
ncbi:MAG: isopentenyl-diphosphate delta-isomerase [Rhodobacterales bacterium 17-64-5]|nr:MAG: isopentenyl-diphosphate delta-isomerase [Rhodobacterales bacterium 17-64-5]